MNWLGSKASHVATVPLTQFCSGRRTPAYLLICMALQAYGPPIVGEEVFCPVEMQEDSCYCRLIALA